MRINRVVCKYNTTYLQTRIGMDFVAFPFSINLQLLTDFFWQQLFTD